MAPATPWQVAMQGQYQFRLARRDNLGRKLVLAAFHIPEFGGHRGTAVPVLEQLDQVADLPGQSGLLLFQSVLAGAALTVCRVDLRDAGADELLDQLTRQQPFL